MARGRRGGRQSRRQPNQTPARPNVPRPSRRGRGGAAPDEEAPTAAPGSAGAPSGSSVLGGGSVQVTAGAGPTRGTLRQRNRGGPRSAAERERGSALRARAVAYDFRYIGSDLRWIFGTTGASIAAVVVLWAILRL